MTLPRPRLRLLLIDDDDDVRRTMRRICEQACEVLEARDGKEAVVLLRERSFDVIVTDLDMPNMRGEEVIAWLVEHRPALARAIIVCTGSVPRQGVASVDGDRILVKPCSGTQLLNAIRRVTEPGAP
jgi:CheY-like chemotaxis protein